MRGRCGHKVDTIGALKGVTKVYSNYQRNQALKLYDQSKSVTKVIQCLSYPTRQALYAWIAARDAVPKPKVPRKKWNNTPNHPLHPSADFKMQVIRRNCSPKNLPITK